MADNTDNQADGGKKKGKGLLIGILAVVLAGGGGAGWFFLKPPADPNAEQQKRYLPAAEPMFVNLDPFTVNLADPGGERMAQLTIVLEVLNQHVVDELKKYMPAVRNDLLLLLSSQESKQMLSRTGKEALAREISAHTAKVLGWVQDEGKAQEESGRGTRVRTAQIVRPNPVLAVHFNQLLVQ